MQKKKSKQESEVAFEKKRRLLVPEAPFAIKESYIKVRTSLMFSMTADKSRNCKTFAVTSACPHDGKSTGAANIALSFAMMDKKTLLIDCDMRKPTQRKIWKIANAKTGLCDYLAKIGPCETYELENMPLTIICNGTIPPNPSELLASDGMKQFVAEMADKYDYVILDTPPINTVADAQIISTYVDGMIMISKSGVSKKDELREALKAIDQAGGNVCGVVLNGVELKAHHYYKYGKYGYKYGYSYEYGKRQRKGAYEYTYGEAPTGNSKNSKNSEQ